MTADQPKHKVDFRVRQQEFAAYIRAPEHQPAPNDVKPERMQMYRELFFNNVEGFLSANFPVLRALLDDQDWLQLVQDFFSSHTCTTPYFSEIPEEFLNYLQEERSNPGDLPFMLELAHYEWTEMALAIAKDEPPVKTHASTDLLLTPIASSPLAWPLAYRYPVHQISPDFAPEQVPEQPTFLVVYRDSEDDVNFLAITPMTYHLLTAIQEYPEQTGGHYLQQLAEQSGAGSPQLIIEHGRQILQDLADRTIIYTP